MSDSERPSFEEMMGHAVPVVLRTVGEMAGEAAAAIPTLQVEALIAIVADCIRHTGQPRELLLRHTANAVWAGVIAGVALQIDKSGARYGICTAASMRAALDYIERVIGFDWEKEGRAEKMMAYARSLTHEGCEACARLDRELLNRRAQGEMQ